MSETSPPVPPVTPTSVSMSPRWAAVIGAFAATIGQPVADVTAKLLSDAVNAADDSGLATLASPADTTDAFWAEMFPAPAVKRPLLNRAVSALRSEFAPAPAAGPAVAPVVAGPAFASAYALKTLGDDPSFLSALVTGGRLNGTVTPMDAAAAVRVALADSIGLFRAPEALVERIEAHAEGLEQPADSSVFDLIDSITSREYGPLLRALGVPQRSVGATQRKAFLERARTTLFPGLRRFHAALSGWYEQYRVERNDPSFFLGALTQGMNGVLMPVTTDTGVLRSAASDLMTMTNRLFSGLTAMPAARAMAMDVVNILAQFNDPKYVTAAGFTSRDEMLRVLKISVTDQFARTERALAQYVINAMEIPNISDPQLPTFAQQLFVLGNSIDWDSLGTARVAESPDGGGGGTPRREGRNGKGVEARFSPFPEIHSSRT